MKQATLETGITHEAFWNMTVSEAAEAIKAANLRQARFIYQSALFSGIAANNPAAFPRTVNAAFPNLFKNESWRESKDFMKQFQNKHNTNLKLKQ